MLRRLNTARFHRAAWNADGLAMKILFVRETAPCRQCNIITAMEITTILFIRFFLLSSLKMTEKNYVIIELTGALCFA